MAQGVMKQDWKILVKHCEKPKEKPFREQQQNRR